MPATPMKNQLYQAGVKLLRPFYRSERHCFRVKNGRTEPLSPQDPFSRMAGRHCLVNGCGQRFIQGAAGEKYLVHRDWAPAGENTCYRAASISKMAVAMAYLRLFDQGLDLSMPVSRLVSLPFQHEITILQLLSHTSGILDGPGYGDALTSRPPLDQLLSRPGYQARPGSFHYSNLGYGLLETALEALQGVSFARAMDMLVFAPLRLDCGYAPELLPPGAVLSPCWRILPPGKSPVYRPPSGEAPPSPPMTHYALAPGGLWLTVSHLTRLTQTLALGGNGFLTQKAVTMMQTPRAAYGKADPFLSYGLGLLIVRDPALCGRPVYGHQGFAYGAVQGAFYEPVSQRGAALLNSGGDESRIGRLGRLNRSFIRWGLDRTIDERGNKHG